MTRTAPQRQATKPAREVNEHRRLDNVDEPLDALASLERFTADLDDVEALVNAAALAVEELPGHSAPEKRRSIGRVYSLVTLAARELGELVDKTSDAVRRLTTDRFRIRRGQR